METQAKQKRANGLITVFLALYFLAIGWLVFRHTEIHTTATGKVKIEFVQFASRR